MVDASRLRGRTGAPAAVLVSPNCDDIHPSPLGYLEMAKAVRPSLFR